MSEQELTKYANAVGLVYDYSLPVRYPLAAVWQVDGETVVTCAHSVILYTEILKALRVRFPSSGREYSIKSVVFHPKVDKAVLKTMAKHGLTDPVNGLPLQKHNVALLKLSPSANELSADEIKEINDSFERFVPDHEAGLGGSLAEIELPLVVQTITNARKVGSVSILDERNRVVGKLFCQNGRATHAYYHNLVNEMAIYQIIRHKFNGSFYFTSEDEPSWTTVTEISRPIDMLLIESLRRTDEMEKMVSIVGGPSSLFTRVTPQPNYDILPPDSREATKLIWPFLDGGTPLGLMWQVAGIDDFSIYAAMQELVKTRQISYFEAPFLKGSDIVPLPLGVKTPLSPNDLVTALWVEDASLAPLLRPGTLLGSVKDLDPSHVLHNIGLPFEAAGCPIFKDGTVIGIHCGAVPPDPAVVAPDGGFHQMIWVEQVIECLKNAGETTLARKLTLSGNGDETEVSGRFGGCRQVARIQCPKCGRSSMDEPNFCKGCGQRLIQDSDYKGPIARKTKAQTRAKTRLVGKTRTRTGPQIIRPVTNAKTYNPALLAMTLVLIFAGGGAAALAMIPKPNIINTSPVILPNQSQAWLATTLAEFTPGPVVMHDKNYVFTGRAKFGVDVMAKQSFYMYAFLVQNSGKVILHTPSSAANDVILDAGARYILVGDGLEKIPLAKAVTAFGCDNSDGTEKILLVASGMKSDLLTMSDPLAQEKAIEQFVNRSLQLLSCDESGNGVIVDAKELGEHFFDDNKPKNGKFGSSGLMGREVYITQVDVRHKKDLTLDSQLPSNITPGNASPTNISPTNTTPTNISPTNTTPTNISPTNTTPTN